MDHVAPNLNGIITTDGSWLAGLWVGGTDHLAAGGHNVLALPHLSNQHNAAAETAAIHVLQAAEKAA